MGNFLVILKEETTKFDYSLLTRNQLLNNSLAKLREYHGSFKSVCDTFSIDMTEFDQIFQTQNVDIFNIWDTDQNGLIDALELFSGLILFADAKFDEKVRFLFDLFDFNELNSLSMIDLEFMIISCCDATYKIYNVNSEINEEEVLTSLLNSDFFTEDSRINISQMLQWCSSVQIVYELLVYIKREPPVLKQSQQALNKHKGNTVFEKILNISKNQKKDKQFEQKNIGQIIHSKKFQQQLQWMRELYKKVFVSDILQNKKDVFIKIDWVYGLRCHDVKRSLIYVQPQQYKNATERYLYFTACIVIIYYPKLNEQKHYVEHDREIISLAMGKDSSLVATGELGDDPSIHVWNIVTLKNIGVIKGTHKHGVHLLSFINKNKYLASCGIRQNSPILIHNLNDFTLLLSTCVDNLVIDMFNINNYIGLFGGEKIDKKLNQIENSFVVCTYEQIIIIKYEDGHFITEKINTNLSGISSSITTGTSLRINGLNPNLKAYTKNDDEQVIIVTGHLNGQVLVWQDLYLKKELINYHVKIHCIRNCELGIVIATNSATLHFWNLSLSENVKNIDLTNFQFKLFSFEVSDLVITPGKGVVVTTEGDVVEIKLNPKSDWLVQNRVHQVNANRNNFISKLTGNLKAISLLEKDEKDRVVYVSGEGSVVYAFSLENHEIIDIWSVGENITAMDSINFEDGGTVYAVGCQNGRIFIRIDWEEQPKGFEDADKPIHDLKFSSDGLYLIAACENQNVYVFSLVQNNYFHQKPKKVHFENEIPICISFTDENKSFLVGTTQKNQYKMELADLKSKNLLQENYQIYCNLWNIRYPIQTKNLQKSFQPLIIGGDIKAILSAMEGGYIFFWKDIEQLGSNCGGFLQGHSSNISRIQMTKQQDIFLSVGVSDNTLIQWKVDQILLDQSKMSDFQKMSQQEIQYLDHLSHHHENLYRELFYCQFTNNISDKLRGQNNFTLYKKICQMILFYIIYLQSQIQLFLIYQLNNSILFFIQNHQNKYIK